MQKAYVRTVATVAVGRKVKKKEREIKSVGGNGRREKDGRIDQKSIDVNQIVITHQYTLFLHYNKNKHPISFTFAHLLLHVSLIKTRTINKRSSTIHTNTYLTRILTIPPYYNKGQRLRKNGASILAQSKMRERVYLNIWVGSKSWEEENQ
jgi:hypothetical protein